jgi:hypothetical protein
MPAAHLHDTNDEVGVAQHGPADEAVTSDVAGRPLHDLRLSRLVGQADGRTLLRHQVNGQDEQAAQACVCVCVVERVEGTGAGGRGFQRWSCNPAASQQVDHTEIRLPACVATSVARQQASL